MSRSPRQIASMVKRISGVNETELGYIDGVTAGTGLAGKAIVLDSSSNWTSPGAGTLTVAASATLDVVGTLEIGGVAVTSTAAELNILDGVTATAAEINTAADASAFSQAITSADAVALGARHVDIGVASGTYAITLGAPTAAEYGLVKTIIMTDATGTSVTMALTNVINGSAATTATWNAVDECLTLIGTVGGWSVLDESGVTLS